MRKRQIAEYGTQGTVVAIYSKIAKTEDSGYNPNGVEQVTSGRCKTCKGKSFRRLSQTESKKMTSTFGDNYGKVTSKRLSAKGIKIK